MIRTFQITAVVLLAIAGYFWWAGNKEGVFVAAVLSACSFFMSIRFQAKARIDQHTAETDENALRK